jgi:hypothetical protein
MSISLRTLRLLFAPLLCVAIAWEANADDFDSRPDSHAPIGVMGDHTHQAGEWMLAYRYARMRMRGNRDGTRDLSPSDFLNPPPTPFQVAPTEMDVEMHMFGLMFAPHDALTLMVGLPFVRKEMSHRRIDGLRFDTRSSGIGDLRITGLVNVFEAEHHELHLNAGVSFPTGSVHEKDRIPGPGNTQLPYPMQLGSGTYDFIPGLTYAGHGELVSWGAQALGTIRTGRNDNGYQMGNRVDLTSWVAIPLGSWVSVSGRAAWSWEDRYSGSDDALKVGPTVVPTADPDRRGGRRLDLLAGINFVLPLGPFGTHRLALEAGAPVYQHLRGPQLELDWRLMVGWQLAGHGLSL